MKPLQLKRELEARLQASGRRFSYNTEEKKLRIENEELRKGVTLSLSKLLGQWETKKEAAIDEAVYYVEAALKAMTVPTVLRGNEKRIFPVIRSSSFPISNNEKQQLLYEEHTAETRIYYAIDMGETFMLLTKEGIAKEQLEEEKIKEMALVNLRSLQAIAKKDIVNENVFYFINHNDGYDASKILNEQLVKEYAKTVKGELAVAVPHQDVIIFADIRNDTGYDILGQMVFAFFTKGKTPITPLPFAYEDGKLEPIFILAKKSPE